MKRKMRTSIPVAMIFYLHLCYVFELNPDFYPFQTINLSLT